MIFLYRGLDGNQEEKVGYISASSKKEALNKVKDTTGLITIYYCEQKLDIPVFNDLRLKFIDFPSNLFKDKKSKPKKKDTSKEAETPAFIQHFRRRKEEFLERREKKKKAKKILKETREKDGIRLRDIKSIEDLKAYLGQDIKIGRPKLDGEVTLARSVDINWDLIETGEETEEMKANRRLRVSRREVITLTRRLHMMLSSGISISRSLDILLDNPNKDIVTIIEGVVEDINEGIALSEALGKYPKQFDPTYVAMVNIGEDSGNLPAALVEIADYLERLEVVRGKLTTASIYPAIIATVLLVTLLLGSVFFIPAFQDMFEGQETALPTFTRFVFRVSDLLPYIILGGGAIVLLTMVLRRQVVRFDRFVRTITDKFKLKMFLIKNIMNAAYMYTISSNINIMLRSGIRLKDTIDLTRQTIKNIYIQNDLIDVADLMIEGYSFSDALKLQATIDELFTSIVLTGEETGDLENSLLQVADYYNYELNRLVDNAMEIVQPVLMVLVGLIAIPVIIAIYLPIFDISTGKML